MNKLSNYFLLLFMSATVLFVSSCGDDTDDVLPFGGATITGLQETSGDGTDITSLERAPGESVSVEVSYDLDDATDISLIAVINDSTVSGPLNLSETTPNPIQTNFDVPSDITEDITVTYQLQDADGAVVDSEDLEITLSTFAEATVYKVVILAAPVGQGPGERTSETFFSATTGMTYSVDNVVDPNGIVSDSIHFGYYYGAGQQQNEATIASPAEYPESVYNLGPNGANWGTLNETLFRPLALVTSAGFDDIVSSDAVGDQFESAGNTNESGQITQLSPGDIYAFRYAEGDDNKFGVFRVDEIIAGIESTGSITLTVKVPAD